MRGVGTMAPLTGTCHIMIQLATTASLTKDDTPTVITHNTMPTQNNAKYKTDFLASGHLCQTKKCLKGLI